MSAPASRFAFIDALRGVAAAMVALGHFYASVPKGADASRSLEEVDCIFIHL